jgi:hypothetical protein
MGLNYVKANEFEKVKGRQMAKAQCQGSKGITRPTSSGIDQC